MKCWRPVEWEVSVEEFLAHPATLRRRCQLMKAEAVTFVHPEQRGVEDVLRDIMGEAPSQTQLDWAAWYTGMWVTASAIDSGAITCSRRPGVSDRLLQYEGLFGEAERWSGDGDSFDSILHRLLQHYYTMPDSPHTFQALACDSIRVRRHFLAGCIDEVGHLQPTTGLLQHLRSTPHTRWHSTHRRFSRREDYQDTPTIRRHHRHHPPQSPPPPLR